MTIGMSGCRAELERREECYDVIVGDLADPIEGGPCYKLYTKSFYESIVKPRLNQDGIFVTQVCTHTYTTIYLSLFIEGNNFRAPLSCK